MTQELSLTKTDAEAYTKGWSSTAKDEGKAIAIAVKKYGDGSGLVNLFLMGYQDKHSGAAKWDSLNAEQLEAEAEAKNQDVTQVSVDGAVIAVTSHSNLDDELAYESAKDAGDLPDVPVEPANVISEETTNRVSIRGLLDSIDRDTPAEERAKIRAEINTRKNHYRMGYNSQSSTLFNGFQQAREGYLKRRPGSAYLLDWEEGYAEAEDGKPFGSIWK